MSSDHNANPAQALIVLGVMAYDRKRDTLHGTSMNAAFSFDRLLDLAKSRGFGRKKQFIGAMRRGKATEGVMADAEAICALVQPAELRREFDRVALWERLTGRG